MFLEDGPGVPKMSLALEQPQGCTGARDIFGTPGPSSKNTTCSFSYRFRDDPGFGHCTGPSGSQLMSTKDIKRALPRTLRRHCPNHCPRFLWDASLFTYSWGLFTHGSSFLLTGEGPVSKNRPNPILGAGGNRK